MKKFSAARLLVASGCAMVVAMAACKSTPQATPLDQLTPQQMRGHAVFQTHCAVCHYDRQNGPLNGPSLMGLYKKPSLPSGAPANDDRVTATILHGRNMMPPMGDTMDPSDRDDLLAYLHTL
jgi:mono/diheme cytochrome c family protein